MSGLVLGAEGKTGLRSLRRYKRNLWPLFCHEIQFSKDEGEEQEVQYPPPPTPPQLCYQLIPTQGTSTFYSLVFL